MKQIDSGTHDVFKTYQEWYDSLADGEKWIAKHGQETKGQIRNLEGVTHANQQARASALAHNEAIKAQTLSAKAGKVALTALATIGNMALMWGITEVISGFVKLSKMSEEVSEKAQKLNNTFTTSKTEIEDYKTQIEDLYAIINDSNSSYVKCNICLIYI